MTTRPLLAGGPITWGGHMLAHPFIQHALLAGTAIALLSGLVGYFVVLRGQVFAGDALSHVAYAGALAALASGLDLRFGLFAATIGGGLALGLLGGRGPADDVVIGTTFAWVLGLGVFFLAVYTTHSSTSNGAANVNVLFGSIFGISARDAQTAAWIAAGLIALLLVVARPLLFSSLDPAVAAARGVPVRWLGPLFLGVVGATAAEAPGGRGAAAVRSARSRSRRCGPGSPCPMVCRHCRPASRSWPSPPPSSLAPRLPRSGFDAAPHAEPRLRTALSRPVAAGPGRLPRLLQLATRASRRDVSYPAVVRRGARGRAARPGLAECCGHSPNTSRVWLTSV